MATLPAIMTDSNFSPSDQQKVSSDEINREVDRICAHPLFSNAPMLRRLLRFTVEKTLAGDTKSVKEFTIGSEGLGRGSSFDPSRSSIVRTQAFNLRQRLNTMYEEQGSPNGVRILYEPGGYIPLFQRAKS
jgi:hypothetical protein